MKLQRWPEEWNRGERLEEYARLVGPFESPQDWAFAAKQTYAMNMGYSRDWRTGMWCHRETPTIWFTLAVILAMNPLPAPVRCTVCGYTPVRYGSGCFCG